MPANMTLTPKQFNKLATKKDLEVFATRHELNEKFDTILASVDGLAKKFDNFSAEMAANQAAHERYEKAITELKTKVRVLERKIGR